MSFLVEVHGADELRDTLKRFTSRPGAVFTKAYRQVAKMAETDARAALDRAGAASADMKGLEAGIKGTARQEYAALSIKSTSDRPTIAAVLGADIHNVWGRKYPIAVLHGDKPWLPHLGNGWQPEDLYGVGPVLASKTVDDIVDVFWEAFVEALAGIGGQVS